MIKGIGREEISNSVNSREIHGPKKRELGGNTVQRNVINELECM